MPTVTCLTPDGTVITPGQSVNFVYTVAADVCELSISGPSSVNLDASCTGMATYSVSSVGLAGNVTWSASGNAIASPTGSVAFPDVGSYTVTATGTCAHNGSTITDTINVVVGVGDCIEPEYDLDVTPQLLELHTGQTGTVTVTATEGATITIDASVPYTVSGNTITFGPITGDSVATITAEWEDGTTRTETVNLVFDDARIVSIEYFTVTFSRKCQDDCRKC